MNDRAELPLRPGADTDDQDRLEVLEHQVRQLMSRLATWVESQLVQAVDDRRSDLRALRSELQAALNEQVAGVRAESASVLTVAVRRLSVNHEELAERLDDVTGRSAEAVAGVAALSLATVADTGRLEAIEHQLSQRIARLTDSVQTQLVDSADRRRSQLDAMRAELEAALGEQVTGAARQAEQVAAQVAVLSAEAQAEGARTEAFEDRLRAAMTRLSESLEARLRDAAGLRLAELDALRLQLHTVIEERVEQSHAAGNSMIGSVVERLEGVVGQASQAAEAVAALAVSVGAGDARVAGLEEKVRTAVVGLQETVDARLAESVSGRRVEVEALRAELHALRTELQRLLDDRLRPVADRASEAAAGLAAVSAAVQAETERTEAFEGRVRAAVVRITESLAGRQAEVDGLREERAAVDAGRDAALDALRAELQAAVDERFGAVSSAVDADAARQEALEERLRGAISRLTESVDGRLAERQADLETLRTEMRTTAETAGDVALRAFRAELDAALDQRLHDVAAQAERAAEGVAALTATAEADAARTEAFEERVRTAIARLTESVDARIAEVGSGRSGEVDALRVELQAALEERLQPFAA
ncbi:MAG: hypothetical protein M3066_15295, partial [Actinomycetota bacterium]|nr:hypothetical protein [Actinomycetota bacterium]